MKKAGIGCLSAIGAVVVIIIIVAVVGAAGGGGSDDSASAQDSSSRSDSSSSTSSSTPTATKTKTTKPESGLNPDAGVLNKVKEGAGFQFGDFKVHKGWNISKTPYIGYELKGLVVQNTTDSPHTFDVAVKLHSGPDGKRIVTEIDCIANSANPGDIVDVDCFNTGSQTTKPFDYITIENTL